MANIVREKPQTLETGCGGRISGRMQAAEAPSAEMAHRKIDLFADVMALKQDIANSWNDMTSSQKKKEVKLAEVRHLKVDYAKELTAHEQCMNALMLRSQRCAEQREALLRDRETMEPVLDALRREVITLREVVSESAEKENATTQLVADSHRRLTEVLALRLISVKSSSPDDFCTQLEFHSIDPKNPERKFKLMIKTRCDRSIRVTDCEPMIPHGLKRAVQKLNDSGPEHDWHSFLIWLRAEFAKLI